jgi:hypothetical protein
LSVVGASPEISPSVTGEISGDANGELIGVVSTIGKDWHAHRGSCCSRFPRDLGLAIALVKASPMRFWFSLAITGQSWGHSPLVLLASADQNLVVISACRITCRISQ